MPLYYILSNIAKDIINNDIIHPIRHETPIAEDNKSPPLEGLTCELHIRNKLELVSTLHRKLVSSNLGIKLKNLAKNEWDKVNYLPSSRFKSNKLSPKNPKKY